jgi:hypothetical protein
VIARLLFALLLAAAPAAKPAARWNDYIGGIWAHVLSRAGLPRDGTVVEIAPGETDKIGRGLKTLGFRGTLFLVEPHREALGKAFHAYQQVLPDARIIPIARTLGQALPLLPRRPDAVVANHPLDDMVVGSWLSHAEFDRFFRDHYERADPPLTRRTWQALASRPSALERAKRSTLQEWEAMVRALSPQRLILSQYDSHFFRQHHIRFADAAGKSVLDRLRSKFADRDATSDLQLKGLIEQPTRWLLVRGDGEPVR